MIDTKSDPIPQSVRVVLELFARDLEGLRFGDVDAACLAHLAERVRERATEVEQARATLEAAQQLLERERLQLITRADEALAYARIYSSREPALAERMATLESKRPSAELATSEERPRRKRSKKEKQDEVELPFSPATAA